MRALQHHTRIQIVSRKRIECKGIFGIQFITTNPIKVSPNIMQLHAMRPIKTNGTR